jgi:hypothetical protein
MYILFVIAVFLGCTALATLLFIQHEQQKNKKDMNQFLTRFRELGSLHHLVFSSHEKLHHAALGVDGIHRKLLLLTTGNETPDAEYLVDLDEVKSCFVKKHYGSIRAAGLQHKKLDQYLKKISLCIEFKNGRPPVEALFYHNAFANIYQARKMEKKARHWETMLSKMLKNPVKEAA